MKDPAYPAARAAATLIAPHFDRHRAAGRFAVGPLAPVPDLKTVEAIIDAAFWASLRREEGLAPKISLVFAGPEDVPLPLKFERPLPFEAHSLTRVAPAVERPGIHLAVWNGPDGLEVWGAAGVLPRFAFVLEVVAPGLLVVKHSRGEESGKFVNLAVLEGDNVKVIDPHAAIVPDCPALLSSLLGLESLLAPAEAGSVLIQLAVSMRSHGRGGLLLVVPSASSQWRESILQPITYGVGPPFSGLSELVDGNTGGRLHSPWQTALNRAIDAVAGLTAVDGATIISDRYEVLAFGAKIVRRPGSKQVERLIAAEPIEGAVPQVIEPTQLGGTRHLAATQFCHDQRNAIAMVASQDGRFTVFAWSPCEDMVHAHRIETLLL